MSYLHSPRLIFTGDFKSDVSTVNNDTAHYNNATFQPSFQEYGTGATNGWWNPEGGASFSFLNCRVEQITAPDETPPVNTADDIIIGCAVGNPLDKSPGKMVDLDPDEQGSSELWAVTLRISTADDELLLQGDITPTGFRDLQRRQHDGVQVNGQPLGGTWTSVLTNIEWGEKASASPFLKHLKDTTQGDKLSLNLNAFGYYYNHAPDGRFSMGRIIGSIAPWFEGEPECFAPARRLYGILAVGSPRPAIYFGNSNFLFEKERRRLTVDLGGSFPVADSTGTITRTQQYLFGVSKNKIDFAPAAAPQMFTEDDFTAIGQVNYETGSDWLNKTGGIVVFDNLSDEVVAALVNSQLVLLTPSTANPGKYVVIAREAIDGYVLRADNFVQRLDSDRKNQVNLYAYQWGKPLADTDITITMQPPTPDTPVGPNNPISEIYGNNYPPEGLTFSETIKTDADGHARLSIAGNPIHSPRHYVDGQIYTLSYQLENIPNDPAEGPFSNDVIFVHLRDYFDVPENPAWSDISEIMTQFGNLYPIMSKYIVDLSDPDAVKAKKDILIFAFTRDICDPLHMPVTRDLSDAKRQAILGWLRSPDFPLERTDLRTEKKAAISDKPEAVSTAELTERQIKLKNAVRAKNGSQITFSEAKNLFEDL